MPVIESRFLINRFFIDHIIKCVVFKTSALIKTNNLVKHMSNLFMYLQAVGPVYFWN